MHVCSPTALLCGCCSHLESLITQEVLRLLNRSGLAEVVERVRLYKVCVCVC
jgi:hypothetical protein